MTPTVGDTASVTVDVVSTNTAAALAADPGERYPAVFGTPFMIALMERACANVLMANLQPGQLSVGAKIEVAHLAATPIGGHVTATARYAEFQKPLHWFDVTASDEAGVVGKGRIARAVVSEADLMQRAAARRKPEQASR
jgi:fluoroacetyl-CoA thioesterase